ncbi:hypothetical protein MMC11_002219 [Xylographa trunciseda]|nr:hypothetical protein [Xylographa trunciseda]
MLGEEVDITRNIFGHLTLTEAQNFAMASRQLRTLLADQAGHDGPPNIDNIANWITRYLYCREAQRGGLTNAIFAWCGRQAGLRSCMGPLTEPFFNGRKERNVTDFHRPHVCDHCHDQTNAACEAEERVALATHQMGMCPACEKRWRRRHPLGWKTCICKFREEQRLCHFCRTDKQIQWFPIRVTNRVRYEHAWKARADGFSIDMTRAQEPLPRCHCGAKHTNHAQRHVAMCFICEGIVVAATAVTGNMRRRSEKVQRKYDDEDSQLPRR